MLWDGYLLNDPKTDLHTSFNLQIFPERCERVKEFLNREFVQSVDNSIICSDFSLSFFITIQYILSLLFSNVTIFFSVLVALYHIKNWTHKNIHHIVPRFWLLNQEVV